jgi:Trm5-related predicted tRNA methylase
MPDAMKITVADTEMGLRERLRERLDRAAELRCEEHGQRVVSVTIYGRENGWFDARWTTCCEALEKQAVAIVKDRV